jgi:hypothetical protein
LMIKKHVGTKCWRKCLNGLKLDLIFLIES